MAHIQRTERHKEVYFKCLCLQIMVVVLKNFKDCYNNLACVKSSKMLMCSNKFCKNFMSWRSNNIHYSKQPYIEKIHDQYQEHTTDFEDKL